MLCDSELGRSVAGRFDLAKWLRAVHGGCCLDLETDLPGHYIDLGPERVLDMFRVNSAVGLSEAEVAQRVQRYGLNRLPAPPQVSPEPTREPGRRTEWGRTVAPSPTSTSPMTVAPRPIVARRPITTGAMTKDPPPP